MDNSTANTAPATHHPLLTAIVNAKTTEALKQAVNNSLEEVGLFDDEEKLLKKIQKLYRRNETKVGRDKELANLTQEKMTKFIF